MIRTLSRLASFINDERHRYRDPAASQFSLNLGQAARYYGFLRVIFRRYAVIDAEFRRAPDAMMAKVQSGETVQFTEEDAQALLRAQEMLDVLHLEIESFYLFAKIFLDQIARFIESYFGQVRKASLDSHDDLTKSFGKFRETHDLNCNPDEFQQTLNSLKVTVADYRDYEISHSKNPRMTHTTTWSKGTGAKIHRAPVYVPGSVIKIPTMSQELPALQTAIDGYIEQVIQLIVDNRDKSRYLRAHTKNEADDSR
jgi:hypothetical protein